ncbi:MAG: hypothetical protein ABI925_06255 [Verrucomicrobiota bacterium]
MDDPIVDRLLRSAALARQDAPIEAPFGFDTRVVALWRGLEKTEGIGLARLLRRVAIVAAAITIITAAGVYREASKDNEDSEPFGNEFVIADSAIQSEFSP